jgi:hypothetical protein
MLIKSASDKYADINILRRLMAGKDVDVTTKEKISKQIRMIQAGAKGESEAAYEINFHFEESPNWMILHDLRLQVKNRVAQIDHILINRQLDVWICESKHFSEGIAFNKYGECTAFHDGKPYGVPSPIEQNKRHGIVIRSLFNSGVIDVPKLGFFPIRPELHSVILVSNGARISRPEEGMPLIETVIKQEQLNNHIDANLRTQAPWWKDGAVSSKDLENIARQIAAMHTPVQFDWAARFGLSTSVHPYKARRTPYIASATIKTDSAPNNV